MKGEERVQYALKMIKDGFSADIIKETCGYKNESAVHNIARKNGLKVVPMYHTKHELIKRFRLKGMSFAQIAEWVDMSEGAVGAVVKKYGLINVELKPETEVRRCEICGKEFTVPVYSNQKYCSRSCARKQKAENPDDSHVQSVLDERSPGWEYIGGYTGSDGFAVVRCKTCGYTTRKSYVALRHKQNTACWLCTKIESGKRRDKRKKIEKEVRHFNRKEKKKQQQEMKTCAHCGAFYFDSRSKYCSPECSKAVMNHYYSYKKEEKRKRARTKDSNSISVLSLYKRDDGICWLCGEACDINADTNSNMYPSVDHVKPISLGGKDEWRNVRLAHRLCNSLRSNNEKVTFIAETDSPVGLQ